MGLEGENVQKEVKKNIVWSWGKFLIRSLNILVLKAEQMLHLGKPSLWSASVGGIDIFEVILLSAFVSQYFWPACLKKAVIAT